MTERHEPETTDQDESAAEENHPRMQDADAFRTGFSLEAGDEEEQPSPELKRFWEAVKHLPAYAKLTTAIVRDSDVPVPAKAMLGLGGGYTLSPIDLIPGIIPVVGQMDDMYAILTALQQSLRRMPDDIAQKHLDANGVTREQIEDDRAAVRDLGRMSVVKTLKFGGKALGRVSRAALNVANNQLQRRNARRRAPEGE